MSLDRGNVKGFEHDRMVMLFSMMDGDKEICCAVSSSAMDDLERGVKAKPDQRDDQFLRLRDRIEQCASRKFLAREFEGTPPGIILRSLDFRRLRDIRGSGSIGNCVAPPCASCESN
jgi:hypothetical protein